MTINFEGVRFDLSDAQVARIEVVRRAAGDLWAALEASRVARQLPGGGRFMADLGLREVAEAVKARWAELSAEFTIIPLSERYHPTELWVSQVACGVGVIIDAPGVEVDEDLIGYPVVWRWVDAPGVLNIPSKLRWRLLKELM